MRRPILSFILSAAVAGHALAATPQRSIKAPPVDAISMGDPRAKLRVDEYASLSCPHCAAFNNEVFPAFKAKYIDKGRVRYTLHEFITPPEQVAVAGFMVARCAGPAKYYAVVDDLFHRQAAIYETHDLRGPLLSAAQTAGLGEAEVTACLQNQKGLDGLNARVKAAVDLGVASTPTFYVNGVKVHEGDMTLEQLDQALAAAPKLRKR